MLHSMLDLIAVVAALYICGAIICRVRHRSSHMGRTWRLLHVLIFSLGGWLAADAIVIGVTPWASCTGVVLAIYMWATREAWANGVPAIAGTGAKHDS